MDAQKLKELRREVELAQRHGTTPDISAWDLFEVLSMAERAVSPAEIVDTLANGWPYDFHMIVKGAEDAAHAEGRRSALEELAKEKERADRAEAELAARQAPDLGHLPCYKLSDGLLIPVGIVKTIIDRGDMMLSLLDVRTALLAQPLQQEGGK
jgi:hypothetical protein